MTQPPDLSACEREPIRTPGSIQPHGVLLSLDPGDLTLLAASANAADVFGLPLDQAFGRPVTDLLPSIAPRLAELGAQAAHGPPVVLGAVQIGGRAYNAAVHRAGGPDGPIILEFESIAPAIEGEHPEDLFNQLLRGFLGRLPSLDAFDSLATGAAGIVRRITGYDRVLLYRFDAGWNGTVIAEDRNERLPSYLDLRFPASDIPAQARELYRVNPGRHIPDAGYEPVPIVSAPGRPGTLDLSFSLLRSVSPVHLEYMRNMETAASMSVSIVVAGELWGLLSCHNRTPRTVTPGARAATELVAQILAMQIGARGQAGQAADSMALLPRRSRLLALMAEKPSFVDGLIAEPDTLMGAVGAEGAAVLFDGVCHRIGRTPAEVEIRRITTWLEEKGFDDVYHTDTLATEMPRGEAIAENASGLLAVAISQIEASYVLWFRPEVVRTVAWGGDPRKPVADTPDGARIHPRRSFETWKETVRLTAAPWSQAEIEAARDLRRGIVDIVLRKAEQVAALARELQRSNRELESFSYSVSHDLRAPFRHVVGFAELLKERESGRLDETARHYLDTIINSAFMAGRLVDDLLNFSQVGRASIHAVHVDMVKVVEEVQRLLQPELAGREVAWRIGPLAPAWGDPGMLRQVVVNLLSNALKFTRDRTPAIIEISSETSPDAVTYRVADNGAGFDMAYVGKLFGVFQRLHKAEEFEGTGIGLANVRRIAERHGGAAWAEGRLGEGATFYVSLPRAPDSR